MIDYPNPIPLNEVDTYVKLAKAGNIPARQALILRNGGLVVSIAIQLCKKCHLPEGIRNDLIQEGLAIIPYAISKYELGSRARFPSYLRFWIYEVMFRYVAEMQNIVHVPRNVLTSERNVRNKKGKINANLKDIEYYQNLEIVLPEIVDTDGSVVSVFEFIPDKNEDSQINFRDFGLKGRENDILDNIINLGIPFSALSEAYGISKQRIQQLYNQALSRVLPQLKDLVEYKGEVLSIVGYEDSHKKAKEYYVKSGPNRYTRKFLTKVGSLSGVWVDMDKKQYKDAYIIPKVHFNRTALKRIFKHTSLRLKNAGIYYTINDDGTSDFWSLCFDSYCIMVGESETSVYLEIISFNGDFGRKRYLYSEMKNFYSRIERIIFQIKSKLSPLAPA